VSGGRGRVDVSDAGCKRTCLSFNNGLNSTANWTPNRILKNIDRSETWQWKLLMAEKDFMEAVVDDRCHQRNSMEAVTRMMQRT
jgi:hypothetical protein